MRLPNPQILILLSITTTLSSSLEPYTNLTCPTNPLQTLPTPQYGPHPIFTVCAQTTIAAPITQIYSALLDFQSYHLWNSFVVNVSARPPFSLQTSPVPLGFQMTFTNNGLVSGLNVTSDEIVSLLAEDVRGDGKVAMNAWGNDGFGPKAQHPNILTDLGDGRTRVMSYESYYGVLLGGVTGLVLKDALQEQFEAQVKDLKAYVEGGGS